MSVCAVGKSHFKRKLRAASKCAIYDTLRGVHDDQCRGTHSSARKGAFSEDRKQVEANEHPPLPRTSTVGENVKMINRILTNTHWLNSIIIADMANIEEDTIL